MKSLLTLLALGTAVFAQTPSLMTPASLKEQAPATYKVKLDTTKGEVIVDVTRASSPRGADRFYNLVKNGFYDGASFFRVVTTPRPFIVQFGMPADPKVGAVWQNARIQDDPSTKANTNARGTIVFATSGPNTRTTQCFINLADNSGLDSQGFTAFGKVSKGMDVVEKFYDGYGEGGDSPGGKGPTQGRIASEGKPYLDKSFPKLDSIKTATIVP
jgi:peptidyl-prolyl cis-trans isomerase A (cyclophilin A)